MRRVSAGGFRGKSLQDQRLCAVSDQTGAGFGCLCLFTFDGRHLPVGELGAVGNYGFIIFRFAAAPFFFFRLSNFDY